MKHRSLRTALGASLLATGLAVGLAVAPAADAAKPVLTINPVRYQINANTSPQFKIGVAHLPSGSKTYIQRQFGSGGVWKNVLLVTRAKYVATAPKVPMGRFVYRLATIKKKKIVAKSVVRGVFGYGAVRVETLCNAADSGDRYCFDNKESGAVGGTLFNYTMRSYRNDFLETYPSFSTVMTFPRSSCRYLSVNFANASEESDQGGMYVQVVQSASDTRTAYVSPGTVAHATFPLDGGPWRMTASKSGGNGFAGLIGAASCWTPSGTR